MSVEFTPGAASPAARTDAASLEHRASDPMSPLADGKPAARSPMLSLLSGLRRWLEQELHLDATGELGDENAAEEILDEVLARAFGRAFAHGGEAGPTLDRMLALAREVAQERMLQRHALDGRFLSLDACPAADAAFRDLGQHHAHRSVVSLLAADSASPEDALGEEQLLACLAQALEALPTGWRRAVELVQIDGEPVEDAQQRLGVCAAELETRLTHADAFLKARLEERGFTLPDASPHANYVLTPSSAAEPRAS